MHRYVFILLIVVLCSFGLLYGQDADSIKSEATGNIEVHARGCGSPPYSDGLCITLNSMAIIDNDSLYEWIMPYIKKEHLTLDEIVFIRDSLGFMAYDVINWLKLKHKDENLIGGRIYEYSDYNIAEGVTDSMGYYVFENVPVGIYQVICLPFNHCPSAFIQFEPIPEDTAINYNEIDWDAVDWDTMPADSIMRDLRTQFIEENCEVGLTNFIRVAKDSTSIVKVYMYKSVSGLESSNIPIYWDEKFKSIRR